MGQIYLHIGLHKTASTMLQKKIFPRLDPKLVIYNPPKLFGMLHRLQYRTEMTEDEKSRIIQETAAMVREYELSSQTMLISNENLSQLVFFQNYQESVDLLYQIFPKAHILLFLRYQPDWLLSCYKQSMKMGDWQSIEAFLNYENLIFTTNDTFYNARGLLHMDVHKADYAHLISIYKQKGYKPHVFFYEKFRQNPALLIDEVCKILNHPPLRHIDYSSRVNKGMSFLKIYVLIGLAQVAENLPFKIFINYKEARKRHYDIYYNDQLDDVSKARKVRSKKKKDKLYFYIYKGLNLLPKYGPNLLKRRKMKDALDAIFKEKNADLLHHINPNDIPKKYMISELKKFNPKNLSAN